MSASLPKEDGHEGTENPVGAFPGGGFHFLHSAEPEADGESRALNYRFVDDNHIRLINKNYNPDAVEPQTWRVDYKRDDLTITYPDGSKKCFERVEKFE